MASVPFNGYGGNLHSVTCANVSTAWAVDTGGALLKTTNGGKTWTKQTSGTRFWLNSISHFGPATAWAVGQGGVIFKTSNSGSTWVKQK